MAYVGEDENRRHDAGGPLELAAAAYDTEFKNLYAKLIIVDLDGEEHEVTPENLAFKTVLQLILGFSASDLIEFVLEDIAGSVRSWLTRGCIVKAYVDFNNPPDRLVFTGMVEGVKETQQSTTIVWVQVQGRDRFRIRLNRRVIATYLDTETSLIVRDLLASYYPHEDAMLLGCSFYEGTGAEVNDESQIGYTGAITGASWVNHGPYGKALSFDGVDDIIVISHDERQNPIYTWEAWVRPLGEQTNNIGMAYRN